MSSYQYFDILPFDSTVSPDTPDTPAPVPIDLDDFAQRLQDQCPTGKIRIIGSGEETHIVLYISTEHEEDWVLFNFYLWENSPIVQISYWPNRFSKALVFWYRHYIPMHFPLFLVIPEKDYIAELTAQTSLDDIEQMYPFRIPDD